MKKSIAVLMCFIMLFTSAGASQISCGYLGITEYTNMDNVPGRHYVVNLNYELVYAFDIVSAFIDKDSSATKSRFGSRANSNTAQTLFAWSGHGYTGPDGGPVLYDGVYKKTDCKFKHLYVVMHTCNWLTNGGSTENQRAIYNTFNGCRLQMGFGSQMYLDSREAVAFVDRLKTQTVGSAYVNAARIYQVQKVNGDSIVKVAGYKDARMDYLNSGKSAAPAYSSSSASSFVEHFNVTIPATGEVV